MTVLHVACRAVMTPVWLDNLTPITVTDCCIVLTQRRLVKISQIAPTQKCKQAVTNNFTWTVEHTSGSCAGVQRQTGGSSPQDLLLGLWPLFLLITLLLSLGQTELEQKEQHTLIYL